MLGWGSAILMQLAHPLVAAGVAAHSRFDDGPLAYIERVRRTIGAMLSLTFGNEAQIRRAADGINAIHRRVHGRLNRQVGPYPAGTPYDATDPELLKWVHSTLIDSQLRTYTLFVGPLTADERDSYCAEAARLGPRLGIPVWTVAGHGGPARALSEGNGAGESSCGRGAGAQSGGGSSGPARWKWGRPPAVVGPADDGGPVAGEDARPLRLRVAFVRCTPIAVGCGGAACRSEVPAADAARVARCQESGERVAGLTRRNARKRSQFLHLADRMSRFN